MAVKAADQVTVLDLTDGLDVDLSTNSFSMTATATNKLNVVKTCVIVVNVARGNEQIIPTSVTVGTLPANVTASVGALSTATTITVNFGADLAADGSFEITVGVDEHSVRTSHVIEVIIVRVVLRLVNDHHSVTRDLMLSERLGRLEVRLNRLGVSRIDRHAIYYGIYDHLEQVSIVRVVCFYREIQLVVLFETHINDTIYVTRPDNIIDTVIYHDDGIMCLRELLRLDTRHTHLVEERNNLMLRLYGYYT